MTAIVYRFVRSAAHESDLALISAFCLTGVVLSVAFVHFGFDLAAGIPG
jgi:hypothetical protein